MASVSTFSRSTERSTVSCTRSITFGYAGTGQGRRRSLPTFIPSFLIESKGERDSASSLDKFSDKTFVITTGVSSVLLVLSTVLGYSRDCDQLVPFSRMLKSRQVLERSEGVIRTVITGAARCFPDGHGPHIVPWVPL